MDISIITTTHNRKELLQQTIESVQKSVFAPKEVTWEHIIYDDGSNDGTEELFQNNLWPNVVYIRGKENRGPSYGKNKAIEAARGTFIFYIDDDDIVLARTLFNFFSAAESNPATDWFISDFLRADEHLSYRIGDDYWGWQFKNPEEMLEAIFRGEHFLQGNVFFKKDLYARAGRFDESMSMAEDLDLYIRFLRLESLPRYLGFASHIHRMHNGNLSAGVTLEKHAVTAEELRKKYIVKS